MFENYVIELEKKWNSCKKGKVGIKKDLMMKGTTGGCRKRMAEKLKVELIQDAF